jgi:hypothetical protein
MKKKKTKQEIADAEYNRLVGNYKNASVDEIKLKINDEWIRKVAELFACLELIKDVPSIVINKKNPYIQKETAAGKMRVKYMAQYSASMQKLNKEMLGVLKVDDDDLGEYE